MARKTWDAAQWKYVDWYTPSKPKNSGGGSNFVDPSVLQDAQINWLSKAEIDKKWWSWAAAAVDVYDKTYGWNSWDYGSKRNGWSGYVSGYDDYDYNLWEEEEEEPPVTITGWYMKNWKWYNEYSDGTTGLASDWDGIWAGSTNWKSLYWNTDLYKNLESKFWQWAADNAFYYMFWTWNKQQQTLSDSWNLSEDLENDYTMANITSYNDAFNHYKSQGMSDEDARAAAAKDVENKNLFKSDKNKEEELISNTDNDDEDVVTNMFDTLNIWNDSQYWNFDTSEYDDLIWNFEDWINRMEEITNSNVIKTSVPEERDTSYDYNTYYQKNLAPDNNYANWESKNTLNDKPQVTLVSQYQEPVTNALNDLGLLTPNEEMAAEIPSVEEATTTRQYNSGEDIVQDFASKISWTWLTPQAAAQTYVDFKNQLNQFAKNNKLSREEYEAYLAELKNNETLKELLKSNNQQ